jgi:hypothetical protein
VEGGTAFQMSRVCQTVRLSPQEPVRELRVLGAQKQHLLVTWPVGKKERAYEVKEEGEGVGRGAVSWEAMRGCVVNRAALLSQVISDSKRTGASRWLDLNAAETNVSRPQ